MDRIIRLESVDSTNRYARMLIRQGAPHGTLVVAGEQTAGRGRRGRGWLSPAGEGVFISLILRPDAPAEKVALLSLQTALAVCQAIEQAAGVKAKIKWPNDIVVGGRKVCGMLLEAEMEDGRLAGVAAGVGINVHQTLFPPEIENTATSLDLASGRRISRRALEEAFLLAYAQAEALAAQGGDALMQAYRGRSATLGQRVQVIALNETFTGTALEVTDGGSLIVLDEKGQRREVLAADVSVRGLMGYA